MGDFNFRVEAISSTIKPLIDDKKYDVIYL